VVRIPDDWQVKSDSESQRPEQPGRMIAAVEISKSKSESLPMLHDSDALP